MKKITIKYKGEERPLVINNGTIMRFEQAGGRLTEMESQPVTQIILLLAAALNLPGDPASHADDFPPFLQLMPTITDALTEAGFIDPAATPGE